MNKITTWMVIAVVVLGGGFLLLTNSQGTERMTDDTKEGEMMEYDAMEGGQIDKDDAMMEKSDEDLKTKDEGAMIKKDGGAIAKAGVYEVYSAEKLARANFGDVVLFFRASWCPTCKALDSNIQANLSNIPASLSILDVDYDSSTALKQKYGVTYQHTLVQVASDGTLIKKWSGSPTLAALVSEVQ